MATRRSRLPATFLGSVALVLLALASAGDPRCALAQSALPDVDIQLILDVPDTAAWLTLYTDALGTRPDSARPLVLSVAAGTGGQRAISVYAPKIQVTILQAARTFKVVIAGKVSGAEAIGDLPAFEQAVLEMQSGAVPNEIVMLYGLTAASGSLTELDITR